MGSGSGIGEAPVGRWAANLTPPEPAPWRRGAAAPGYAPGIAANTSNLLDFLVQFAQVKRRNGLDTAHFFLLRALREKAMNLGELLEATLPPLGYELVDWEMSPRSGLVRVFIDKPKGVDVEDCARVSHHLTHLFAVENVANRCVR
jgi:hypothetical protein